jgi:hypothetical protein
MQKGYTQVSSSPLTQQGIGDLYGAHLANSYGMAGIGISNGTVRYINNQNPALLVYNSIYTYSAGVIGESRRTSNGVDAQKPGSMNLSNIGMSFPIKSGKWVSSIMLSPYSNVDFQFTEEKIINGITYDSRQKGSQGLAQLEWAHGIRITKNFNIGAKVKYLFGSIKKESSNVLTGTGVNSQRVPTILDRDAVSDLLFGLGMQYRYKLTNDNYLNFGLIYDLQADVNTNRLQTLETRNTSDIVLAADTLLNDEKGAMLLPSNLGFGISVGKPLSWLAGVDIRLQQWKDFRNFSNSSENLQNAITVAVGGEFTPDAGSIDKFFNRVTYRIGASYERTPYVVEGAGVNDVGINFGWSMPVGISSLDMGFRFGKRGSLSDHEIKESYFRTQLGMTINDRLWFIKRKFD